LDTSNTALIEPLYYTKILLSNENRHLHIYRERKKGREIKERAGEEDVF
jgi:hypothetical protein